MLRTYHLLVFIVLYVEGGRDGEHGSEDCFCFENKVFTLTWFTFII